MDVQIYNFTSTDWELLSDPTERIIVKNSSSYPVTILETSSGETPTVFTGLIPVKIGGIINEVEAAANKYVWAKADDIKAFLRIRPFGTLDPEMDSSHLAAEHTVIMKKLNDHLQDKEDPHEVTKEQVGLGNIPNAISDNPDLVDKLDVPTDDPLYINTSEILATVKAVKVILDDIDTHKKTKNEDHNIDKADVGLGLVANYGVATTENAFDSNCNDKYMTPATTFKSVEQFAQVAYSSDVQLVLTGKQIQRPMGWGFDECNYQVELVTKTGDRTFKINEGLSVSFASFGRSRISNVLATSLSGTLSNEYVSLYYIYVDIDLTANIIATGSTVQAPQSGSVRESNVSDFFNTSNCCMYDVTDKIINRVYIAKIYCTGDKIVNIISAPIGKDHILPVTLALAQNTRIVTSNPYIEDVDIKAEIKYQDTWVTTGWNDQIGVTGNLYPGDNTRLVIQSGLMGLLACGQESGSNSGLVHTTITSPVKTRLTLKLRR